MTTVVIPGDRISSELDFHRFISKELDFGPYYGKNLDALWDRLTTDVERPVHIVWSNATISRNQLGQAMFEKISNLLRLVEMKDDEVGYSNRFTVEFRD